MAHRSERHARRGAEAVCGTAASLRLRVLLIEGSEANAASLVHELERAGFSVKWERVDMPAALASAIDHDWDLIICAWDVPTLSGAVALRMLCGDRYVEAPIVVVCGVADAAVARRALNAGADEVIGRRELDQLAPFVARAAADAPLRRERRWRQAVRRGADHHVRTLLASSADLSAIIDADGTIHFASAVTESITGTPADEVVGRSAFDWIHPLDLPKLRRRLARATASPPRPGRLLCRARKATGSWATLDLTIRDLRSDPVVAGLLVTGRDVTAARRAERLMRRRAADLADLYDHAPCGYHSLDRAGRFVAINSTELRWLGYRREELIGRLFTDVVTPAGHEVFARHFPAFVEAGEMKNVEYEMIRKDGSILPVQLNATAVRDAQGRLVRSRSTVIDLTERKAAEQVVRASERRFRRLLEFAPDAVLAVGEHGERIEFANERALRLFNYEREELIGQPIERLVPERLHAQHQQLRAGYTDAAQARPMAAGREVPARRRDGSEFIADITIGPADLGTASPMFLAVVRDVTEAKRAERLRRERTRLLDAVFDHSLSCLVLLDPAFNFIRVNPAYAESCRRPIGDFEGRNHFDLYPSDLRSTFEDVIRSKQPFEIRARPFSFPDQPERGETYWDLTLVPLLDDQGAVEMLLFSLHDVTEHVRMSRALEIGEERFRALIERSLDLIAIVGPDGNYRYVNPAHDAVCGFTPEQLVGTNAFGLLHPDDAAALAERFQRGIAGGEQSVTVEYRLRSRDGGWRFIEGMVLNLLHDPGVGGVLVTGRDVTDRRRAEAELRANSERLEVSLRVASLAAFNQDRDLRYTWVAQPQLGYEVGAVLGHTDDELLAGPDVAELVASKRQVIASGVGARREVRLAANGQEAWFDIVLQPLLDAAGGVIGLTGASSDISERKQSEEVARAHALRLELVQEVYRTMLAAPSVRDVVAAVLPRICLLVPCQLAILVLIDRSTDEAHIVGVQGAAADHVHERSSVPLAELPPLAVFTERPEIYAPDIHAFSWRSPIVQRLFDGGARTLLAESLVVHDELLGVFAMCAATPDAFTAAHRTIAREVADQLAVAIDRARLLDRLEHHTGELELRVRERTEELEQANRDLESFTYSVSHDLRAPLRRVEGFSRALMEDFGSTLEPGARKYVDAVVQGSARMAQLIDDLLRLARLAQQPVVRERVDLSALALAARSELHIGDPRRQVVWTIAPDVVVDGDARLLRIVLENLLGNAWKFTGRRDVAHIEFGVGTREGRPVYFVRDDGAGFEMAYADRLFGVFQRLHKDSEFEGTGIGLATVQRIIQRHGGAIWAEGAAGRGATFWFTLAPADAPATRDPA